MFTNLAIERGPHIVWTSIEMVIPSGKRVRNYGQIHPFLMGKLR